jgi:hypothetical protein
MPTYSRGRLVVVSGLAVTFNVLYRLDWPGFWLGGPLKPTLLVLAVVLAAHYLRVASWPLVLAFSLLPFVLGTLELLTNNSGPIAGGTPEAQLNRIFVAAISVLLSPITLLGPVLVAVIAHIAMTRLQSNLRWSGP